MSEGEFSTTDLFGDEILPARGGRGRPAHVPTLLTRNRVLLGLVRGLTNRDIASTVGLSVTSLKEHYSTELKLRKSAKLKMEMRQLERLNTLAEAGSVAAEKELAGMIEKLRMRDEHRAAAPKPKTKQPALGKKEMQQQRALDQEGLYRPPSAPVSTH